ncbi:hypothetical protein tb265_41970 [Gemmatimonadetes bacterium T265]|nr:hypothetical protein tb265_41970 [Gemmatimonadetes bacterium T265]
MADVTGSNVTPAEDVDVRDVDVSEPHAAARAAARAAWCVGVTYVLLTLQAVTLTGRIIDEADGPAAGPSAKPYHVALLVLGLLVLRRGRVVRWRPEMACYFAVTCVSSAAAYLSFGARAFLANMLVAAFAATVAATLGYLAGPARTLVALRAAAAVTAVAVCVKLVAFRDLFLAFFAAPDGHPLIPGFFGGGPNLEATWVAAAGLFFLGTPWGVPYALVSLVISVLYVSRIGIMVAVAVLVTAAVRARRARRAAALVRHSAARTRLAVRRVAVAACLVGACGLGARAVGRALPSDGVTAYLAERFATVGEDKGSQGRLTLWRAAADVFAAHPFGVGQGNAMDAVAHAAGEALPEDNLHNQFLQHLVETGPQGCLAYVVLAVLTWARAVTTRGRDPLVLFCALYFLLSTVQFRGADALLWFVYGLQVGGDRRRGRAAPAPRARTAAARTTGPAPFVIQSLPA